MKIREGFVLREVDDNIVVVPTGDLVEEFQVMITLNSTAKFIWEMLEEDTNIEELVDKMMKKYNISEEIAKRDVEKIIEKLRISNILVD